MPDNRVRVVVEFASFEEASQFVTRLQSQPELLEGTTQLNNILDPKLVPTVSESFIFISYRRADSSDIVYHLYNALASTIGAANVFMDVENIALGVDFRQVLNQKLNICNVMLVLIDPQWDDERQLARLHNPEDYVRIEIETALARNIRVIPLLVLQRDSMPDSEKLPPGLHGLVTRNGMQLRPGRDFQTDIQHLLEDIIKPPN